MELIIILGLFSGLFAFLSRYEKTRWGLKVSFGLIFIFLALRYDYGNDYQTYLKAFEELNKYGQYELSDALTSEYGFEPGWVYLNLLFRPLGFFGLTVGLAFVNCLVYYFFIKTYVPVKYYWLAVSLYVFEPEFLLIQLSAMRQTVAIILFLVSINFLFKKQLIQYFLCIGIASLFHTSAIFLLPVCLLSFFNRSLEGVSRTITGAIILLVFTVLYVFNKYISGFLNGIIDIYFNRYHAYQDSGALNTGLGIVYGTGILFVILFYGKTQYKRIALIVNIAILNYFLLPFTLMISMIARMEFYLFPAVFVAYPVVLNNIKLKYLRVLLVMLISIYTARQFYGFVSNPENIEFYGHYKTIFSASEWH